MEPEKDMYYIKVGVSSLSLNCGGLSFYVILLMLFAFVVSKTFLIFRVDNFHPAYSVGALLLVSFTTPLCVIIYLKKSK